MWDFLPVNLNEIKQIEVIRGPASAVWGANAVYGVINVITKSPREMQGTTRDRRPRHVRAHRRRGCRIVVVRRAAPTRRPSTIAGRSSCRPAATRRIRCRVRPALIPGSPPPGTAVIPPFTNTGTTQPKFDGRRGLRLRGRREALLHGRRRRDRRHHALRHRPVRHQQRLVDGVRPGQLPAEGAPRGRRSCSASTATPTNLIARDPHGRVHPVRVQDEHDGRRVVEREDVRHAPRRHLRRQPAAQHVRSLDCAAQRQPHGVRRLRRRTRSSCPNHFRWTLGARVRPLRLPGRASCSRRGRRS